MTVRSSLFSAVAVLLFCTSPALADDYRTEEFRYGYQALGTGGAFIARPTSPMATYYNPAGLAFQERSAVSGSIHFFGTEKFVLRDGLRSDGKWSKDLTSDSDMALPSCSVVTLNIDRSHRIAFSTFLISNASQNFHNALKPTESDDSGIQHDYLMALTRILQDRETWMGPTYAYAVSSDWGVGASLFYARRSMYWQTETRLQDEQSGLNLIDQTVFYDVQSSTKVKDGRLLLRLGASWTPSPNMALGLVVTTPSIRLHGDARLTVNELWSGDPAQPDEAAAFADHFVQRADAETASPWGTSLGFQYRKPGAYALAVATDLWLPLSYNRIRLKSGRDEEARAIREQFAASIDRDWLVNAKVGLELYTFDAFPIRMGVYTNRSAAQSVPERSTRYIAPKVDVYGGAFSVGYATNDAGISIGVNIERGIGHDLVEEDVLESYTDAPKIRVDREHTKFVIFVAGALNFASKTAQRYFKAQERD